MDTYPVSLGPLLNLVTQISDFDVQMQYPGRVGARLGIPYVPTFGAGKVHVLYGSQCPTLAPHYL